MKIEFQLSNDGLGRWFRVVPVDDGKGWDEGDFPCNGCEFGRFNIDTYICTRLPHRMTDVDEFKGTDSYPFRAVADAAEVILHRPVEFDEEDIEFYACDSRAG
ncbi:MAG: hypothetical protein ACRCYD_03760 [Plesiomonas sp.]